MTRPVRPLDAAITALTAAADAADQAERPIRAMERSLARSYGGPQDTTDLGLILPGEHPHQLDGWWKALALCALAMRRTGLPVDHVPATPTTAAAFRRAADHLEHQRHARDLLHQAARDHARNHPPTGGFRP